MTNTKFVGISRLLANAEYQKPMNTIIGLATAGLAAGPVLLLGNEHPIFEVFDKSCWIGAAMLLSWLCFAVAIFSGIAFAQKSGDWVKELVWKQPPDEDFTSPNIRWLNIWFETTRFAFVFGILFLLAALAFPNH